ncbi:Mediator of RNA polymerase II transcription subunit 4 [Blattella germanica]|nr:Mediator of RNA polymerase II transcription subunit 4 [Blattella germanica]
MNYNNTSAPFRNPEFATLEREGKEADMASNSISTGERLLGLIDDIELISKELIENTIAQKHQKLSSSEHLLITELLVSKDNELKEVLKLATEQAKINHKMEALKGEVERQDQYIQQLQRQLKEAEQILVSVEFKI